MVPTETKDAMLICLSRSPSFSLPLSEAWKGRDLASLEEEAIQYGHRGTVKEGNESWIWCGEEARFLHKSYSSEREIPFFMFLKAQEAGC